MNRREGQKFDLLAVLLVLCIFSVTVLALLLNGAKTYKGITQNDQISRKEQIESLYISNKIFQASSADAVSVKTEDGVQVLSISSVENGQDHITRVYCSGGWIMELYSDADYSFSAGDGERISEADSLEFSLEGRLLFVRIKTADGDVQRYYSLKEGSR